MVLVTLYEVIPATECATDGGNGAAKTTAAAEEPSGILCVGGPLNGKAVADTGQKEMQNGAGDLYKRVAARRIPFDVLAYWGKTWHQEI